MAKKKTLSRADKAVILLADVLMEGAIVTVGYARGDGITVGPYRNVIDERKPANFAVFDAAPGKVRPGRSLERMFVTALDAADYVVTHFGVGNVIEALKKVGTYQNLDTPVKLRKTYRKPEIRPWL